MNRKDGKFPLKINVTHKRQQALINLGVLLSPDQWDSTKGKVINGPNKSFLNGYISQRVHCAETELLNLRIAGKLDLMTGKQFKEHLQRILLRGKLEEKQEETGCSFVQYYTRFVEGKKNPQTKAVYQYTLDRICRFVDVPDKFRFEDVTYAWLKSFEIHLSETSKVNSISIHMRNIRAVFNDALNTETISCYPFRRFKIKQEATAKRALTPEELVTLRDYPCEEHQKQYVDIFMLIFYLVGINTVDLCRLEKIRNGRIEYRRAKTKKIYNIKVEPEAAEIIERYKGSKYLLNILERYKNYKDYAHRLNENLQEIGSVELVEKVINGKRRRVKKTLSLISRANGLCCKTL
ncbi:phage integrase SAM-like domain-containing protein [Bacteroides fragilis]